jgi:hypothetical protein
MTKDDLETSVNELQAFARTTGSDSAQRLAEDVFNFYYLRYDELGLHERQAWDWSVGQRLQWMKRAIAVPVKDLPLEWLKRVEASGGVRQIHFGQLRAANNFQSAETVHSVKEVVGKTVQEVASAIASGEIRRDLMPIQIFYHVTNDVWVAINNRGFAAHCVAAAVPLRLIPRQPSADEFNRLAETAAMRPIREDRRLRSDDDVEVDGFTLPESARTMLPATTSLAGRALPSALLPLTPGPVDIDVMGVVRSVLP